SSLSYPTPFFFNHPAHTQIFTLSLHDALPICQRGGCPARRHRRDPLVVTIRKSAFEVRLKLQGPAAHPPGPVFPLSAQEARDRRSEEHTSELQSLTNLVCRLLLEKKNEHTTRS